jgi:molybdopterin-containing oxidoreductase family iron-sulfur binding subunit
MPPINHQRTGQRTDGARFWQSLEERAGAPEFLEKLHNELPYDPAKPAIAPSRRDVLKLMAASAALAGLTGCTRMPMQKIVPYARQPEEIVPGKPLYYATSMTQVGVATGLLVESHMGRPTKIEGNPNHPGSLGSTDLFAQASLLTLYDPDRSAAVMHEGRISDERSLARAIEEVRAAACRDRGAGLRILTETVTSPSLAQQILELLTEFPLAKWHEWEPLGRDAARAGAMMAYGRHVNTGYRFDQADIVVAIDADFLCEGPGHVRYAREFADRRRVKGPDSSMNRLYVAEVTPSNTGSIADHRLALGPRECEAFARALAAELRAAPADAAATGAFSRDWLQAVARDLAANKGRSIVIAGDYQPAVTHALVHAMNEALGNVGHTVMLTDSLEARPIDQAESLRALVDEMNAGQVATLAILGSNPVFTAPADLQFARRLEHVPTRIHLGLYFDETAALCHWHVPEAHYLESWGDARAFDGTIGIIQPLIAPMYNGRSAYEIVAAFAGSPELSNHDAVHDYWQSRSPSGDFEAAWRRSLHDGVMAGTSLRPINAALKRDLRFPASTNVARDQNQIEIVFRADPTIGDGRWANNAWLQELPKPFSKLTWDNAAMVSPATAARLALRSGDVVNLSVENRQMQAPVWILPGQPAECVTLHVGYGRAHAGNIGTGKGFNVYGLRSLASPWSASAGLRKLASTYPLAGTQQHYIIRSEGKDAGDEESATAFRRDLVQVATLAEFRDHPDFARHPETDSSENNESLYPAVPYSAHAWAMSIDLNSCIGCSACVVACQSENNIAVVGKDEVINGRAMHWLRIDTYYRGDPSLPEIYHEPVPCMQCENAPCELVCPVGATQHSPEGLNNMVYNRCVGTRYCSNNCPYKVRRFNFRLYSDWNTASLYGLRNPDVTVRSRGVMEKCTYCVQRINGAKIQAEKEDRTVRDGEIQTACQQVCPTQAIAFGDQNEQKSRVSMLKSQSRNYSLLADLNTRPRTTYLARLRNPNPAIGTDS